MTRSIRGMRRIACGALSALSLLLASPAAVSGNGALFGDIVTERVSTSSNTSQRDLVVYLQPRKPAPLKPPREPVLVAQRQLAFDPHVVAVVVGTRLRFTNEDPIAHNVQSKSSCCALDKDMDKGQTLEQVLDKPGFVELTCRIHPEMLMYVAVLDTPYFTQVRIAKEDAGGKSVYRAKYALHDVPPGEYTLHTWNKKLQPVAIPVTIAAHEQKRLDLELKK